METGVLPQQFPPTSGVVKPLPACWGASEGAAGMANQVRGIAAALGTSLDLHRTVLKYPWRWFSPNYGGTGIYPNPPKFNGPNDAWYNPASTNGGFGP